MKRKNNLPHIWIPTADSFYEVEKVPILGTGKLDLAAVKQVANSLMRNEK